MRKDFNQKDKQILAQRSGYICSYPSCHALTIAPNEEGVEKTSSIGMACHIYAASDGKNAKRVNVNMTDEQLSDISNGIWMCYTHGKLIDTDECRFSAPLLMEWKNINEEIALFRQETGADYLSAYKSVSLDKLISNEIILPKEFAINNYVGDALHDSYVGVSWGREVTDAVRDFLIEYIRNAHGHGHADNCTLQINAHEIIVTDDGYEFDARSLYHRKGDRGGYLSIRRLLDFHGENILLSSYRENDSNYLKISLPRKWSDVSSATPCTVNVDIRTLLKGEFSYQIKESCNEIFIILPSYFGLSDIGVLKANYQFFDKSGKHLVFVLSRSSEYAKDYLSDFFEGCQVMMLDEG